jgi:hypothetical protein
VHARPGRCGAWGPALALLLATCGRRAEPVQQPPALPSETGGWRADGAPQRFDRRTIFRYLDGGGEVYLAFGMRSLTAQRYVRDGEGPITVDLFDMGSSDGAFGMFAFEREDADAGIGQGSEYAAGLLRFWKGPYFVAVQAERETDGSRRAVLDLGRRIADAVPETGAPPAIVGWLPAEGLRPESVRYVRTAGLLPYHCAPCRTGGLEGSGWTEATIARYGTSEERARLVILRYRDAAAAEQAALRFREAGGGGPPAWSVRAEDGVVAVVVEATDPSQAEALAAAALANARREGR